MPRRHRLVLLAAAVIAGLAVACSSGGASSTATPQPSPTAADPATPVPGVQPPSVTLAASGASPVAMRIGTYCWGGICADAIGILTPLTPISASAGGELTFGGEAFATAPAGTSFLLWTVPDAPVDARDDWQAWRPESDPITVEVVDGKAVLPADLAPGSYLAALFVNFAGGGDGSYGIVIDVGP